MAQTQEHKAALHIRRVYPAAAERVWRAWTDPQALSQWFGPAQTRRVLGAELDVREGGAWRIRFETDDGEDHQVSGVYQVVEPLQRLQFTWAWQSTPERVSLVTVALRPVEGGTELDFRHERFFDQAARDGHARGWGGTFEKLDAWMAKA